MTQRERMAAWTATNPGCCDGCVAAGHGVTPQVANQWLRILADRSEMSRTEGTCARCGTYRIVNVRTPVARAERTARTSVLDGAHALREVLVAAGYPTVLDAVAAHAVFVHPDTVAETGGEPLFRIDRAPLRTPRGRIATHEDGRPVWLDDNTPPTHAFLWATGLTKGRDVQFNHIWRGGGVRTYTALWNLCVTPAFLAKPTDNDTEVTAALRYRAWDLYGAGTAAPKPERYDAVRWRAFPEPVRAVEAVFRDRLRRAPSSATARAAREVGWLFSRWEPDTTL